MTEYLYSLGPRLCRVDRREHPAMCRTCNYVKNLGEKLKGAKIGCQHNFNELFLESLDNEDREILEKFFDEMLESRTGVYPIELAAIYAFQTRQELRSLGEKIVPLKRKGIEKEVVPEEDYDIRASELNERCAIPVFFKRLGLWPVDDIGKKRMRRGTLVHHLSLDEPETLVNWNYDFFAPRFYFDNKYEQMRTNYCEVADMVNLYVTNTNRTLTSLKVEFKPDAVVKIVGKKKDYAIPFDLKTGESFGISPSKGYQRQVCMYGIAIEKSQEIKVPYGFLFFNFKLGKGPSIRHFNMRDRTKKGRNIRHQTKTYAVEFVEAINDFQENPNNIYQYKNNLKSRCRYSGVECHNFELCNNTNLLDRLIRKVKSNPY